MNKLFAECNIVNKNIYPVYENMEKSIIYVDLTSKLLIDTIKKDVIKSVNIFTRGSSGAILGTMLYMKLKEGNFNVYLHHIKKKEENSRSQDLSKYLIVKNATNIIIDDMVCSGSTIRSILSELPHHITVIDYVILSSYYTNDCLPEAFVQEKKIILNVISLQTEDDILLERTIQSTWVC